MERDAIGDEIAVVTGWKGRIKSRDSDRGFITLK